MVDKEFKQPQGRIIYIKADQHKLNISVSKLIAFQDNGPERIIK